MGIFGLVVFGIFGSLCLIQFWQLDHIKQALRQRHPAFLSQSEWRFRRPIIGILWFAISRADLSIGDTDLSKRVERYKRTRIATVVVWLVWLVVVVTQFQ
jgi:hypothetical protein